jgi:hypothetical protein
MLSMACRVQHVPYRKYFHIRRSIAILYDIWQIINAFHCNRISVRLLIIFILVLFFAFSVRMLIF